MESVASFQMTTKPERSERIENLYRYITSFRYGICVERGKLLTEFYSRNMNLPAIVRRARAIDHVLSNMTVYIMPDSLFAGNQASCPRWHRCFRSLTWSGSSRRF